MVIIQPIPFMYKVGIDKWVQKTPKDMSILRGLYFVYILFDKSAHLYKEWREYQCNDSHKLNKNVDGRS